LRHALPARSRKNPRPVIHRERGSTPEPATLAGFGGFPQTIRQMACHRRGERNSFPLGGISYLITKISPLCFQQFKSGTGDALTENRRSGAQRGAPEKKLRPEVFLSAPCIFRLRHSPPALPQFQVSQEFFQSKLGFNPSTFLAWPYISGQDQPFR
jgi:hypothetical protein